MRIKHLCYEHGLRGGTLFVVEDGETKILYETNGLEKSKSGLYKFSGEIYVLKSGSSAGFYVPMKEFDAVEKEWGDTYEPGGLIESSGINEKV